MTLNLNNGALMNCVCTPQHMNHHACPVHGIEASKITFRAVPKTSERDSDIVNHPPHYTFGKYEVLDVLLDWFPKSPLLWQVVKYVSRAAHKGNELQDLKKAQFYLNKQIELMEKK